MTYLRVIPRDLFNEANLLKCMGQLYLKTEGMSGVKLTEPDAGDGFMIDQDDCDGSLSVTNVRLFVRGRVVTLSRPLNSREPWPLYAINNADGDEVSVFNDAGELTEEFTALINPPPIQYVRGCDDYAAIRDAASSPAQVPAIVSAGEYEEMLGCVPPIYVDGVAGFLVGEALTRDARGTVYANYYQSRDGLFCARYHVVEG